MSRPLLITDCDEVLLHMVSHFGTWLGEAHEIDMTIEGRDFSDALTRRACGTTVPAREVWPLLDGFFDSEMHRQTLVPGAREALATLAPAADIVILTNLTDHYNEARAVQLAAFDIRHRVITNQGGKGDPVSRLVAEYRPTVTVFVDDLPQHHQSVAEHAPQVFRIHMIAEPRVAVQTPPAPDAHVRIDDWFEALPWIEARFRGEALP